MHPVLFRIGGLAVPTHEFFVALGVLCASLLFVAEAKRTGVLGAHAEEMEWIVIGALLGGAVGAKLAAIWRYVAHVSDPTVVGLILQGGRSILGGLAGAYVGAVVAKRLVGYRRRTGDLFAPGVALGMAIGRVGCLLTEQIGTPTAMPWGITLSSRSAAALRANVPECAWCVAGVGLHPSFAYEIVFHLTAFGVLWWWLRPRPHVEGDLFKVYLLWYALFRFFVEFVRGNDVVWAGLTRSQLVLIPTVAVLALYFVRRRVARVTFDDSSLPQPISPLSDGAQ
jgi:phosphatidylglycerol:prolipoprotein diacylglycerol transferase